MDTEIPLRAQVVAIIGCTLLFVFVLELVRRRRLKEEYSIVWMAASFGTALLAAWSGLLIGVTRLVGAYSANSVIFFFGLLFLAATVLHLTVRVSGLMEDNKDLAQELALLRSRLDEQDGHDPS
jgi:tellurite resistance protein TehA-like permease